MPARVRMVFEPESTSKWKQLVFEGEVEGEVEVEVEVEVELGRVLSHGMLIIMSGRRCGMEWGACGCVRVSGSAGGGGGGGGVGVAID